MSFQPGAMAGGASIDSITVSYVEFTANVTISATTEGTANTIVTAADFTADGVTPYWIEYYAPAVVPVVATSGQLYHILYDGGSSIGVFGAHVIGLSITMETPIHLKKRLTPAAGVKTYSVRAYQANGNATVFAGAGGSGLFMPGYITVYKAV